jgi:putative tricarboxylic transport membrane protein
MRQEEATGGGREDAAPRGLGVGVVEAVTALLLAGIGAAALWDSRRIGAGWTEDGPQSGYFPFWVGTILVLASLGTLVRAMRSGRRGQDGIFVTWPQLRLVLSVLVPTAVYVAVIPTLGIYLASALLVAYCMMALGRFAWWVAVPAGLAVTALAFVTFEIWFLVALPKGPVEEFLGY